MRPIVFLHLPKTAGQSVRAFLSESFPKRLMFPGQIDEHLTLYSTSDLKQFSVFSGHFSWALLDCLGPDPLFFTVLREPAERIISFYRFLRRQAEGMPKHELDAPQNQGIRAALDNPFERFLDLPDGGLRSFMLNHIDNYYMYYFATRMMHGRSFVRGSHPESDHFISEQVMQVAIRNIRDHVRVFNVSKLQEMAKSLSAEDGFVDAPLPWINRAPNELGSVGEMLEKISDDPVLARKRLHFCSQFDAKLYQVVAG